MPDLDTIITAIKTSWVKRLLNDKNNYYYIASAAAQIHNFKAFFEHNMDYNTVAAKSNDFYKQIINCWQKIKQYNKDPNEILNEKIFFNKNITIGGKPIEPKTLKINASILYDILNFDYTIKSYSDLKRLHPAVDQLQYNSLTTAIPNVWLVTLKHYKGKYENIQPNSIKIGVKYKHIATIKCREFYKKLITRKYIRPTALYKWEETYFYASFDWQQIFRIPYICNL